MTRLHRSLHRRERPLAGQKVVAPAAILRIDRELAALSVNSKLSTAREGLPNLEGSCAHPKASGSTHSSPDQSRAMVRHSTGRSAARVHTSQKSGSADRGRWGVQEARGHRLAPGWAL